MADTSLSKDSPEPEIDLVVPRNKSKKKKRNLYKESPFPQSRPCVKGALVKGLVSNVEEEKGYFWLQRDPDKVEEVGEMLKRSQDEPLGGGDVKVGSAVVAEWEGNLYRGVVNKAKSGSRLLVQFVDWGNSDVVTKNQVRCALATELQEPSLAIRYH